MKYDIAEIGDDVLNFSTTHAIIEQHLVDTKLKYICHKIVMLLIVIKKIELCDSASVIHTPQLMNGIDSFVLDQK
jgi:hypothetical protein